MKKDEKVFLKHILECIKIIGSFIKKSSKGDFIKSIQMQDAVMRRIGIIGEAVKNLPAEFRKKHPEIEWSKIAGTRDVMIHDYFGIDLHLTWDIAKKDLPELKEKIKKILKEVKDGESLL